MYVWFNACIKDKLHMGLPESNFPKILIITESIPMNLIDGKTVYSTCSLSEWERIQKIGKLECSQSN